MQWLRYGSANYRFWLLTDSKLQLLDCKSAHEIPIFNGSPSVEWMQPAISIKCLKTAVLGLAYNLHIRFLIQRCAAFSGVDVHDG